VINAIKFSIEEIEASDQYFDQRVAVEEECKPDRRRLRVSASGGVRAHCMACGGRQITAFNASTAFRPVG
jgi:hypothetical protein